ncbi:MAG: helix-turn-helix domain-containing protein [Rhodospirillales bacterium]|nr:helix-turn-helix domain-containing protein [Rhodospirillales bacterium]
MAKKKWKPGHYSSRRKLTMAQVADIRERLARGEGIRAIAKRYAVGERTIYQIVEGRTYQEVPPAPIPGSFVRLEARRRLVFPRWLWEVLGSPERIRLVRQDGALRITAGDDADIAMRGQNEVVCWWHIPFCILATVRLAMGEYPAFILPVARAIRVDAPLSQPEPGAEPMEGEVTRLEAARILGISHESVRQLGISGRLPVARWHGGHQFFSRDVVLAFDRDRQVRRG